MYIHFLTYLLYVYTHIHITRRRGCADDSVLNGEKVKQL